ncbi:MULTISPECIES: AI-2E family transporter [unclassified Wenzhouxiangella]|uniref:AI-2E family transporter n=1 Tax=unclassified Wenzhouxiangella TaxID=2613841 RepID=UPI000E3267CE|nr:MULTISPECIES: AI-2E family transporter [unclassified Wenzhouxiangella]RFF27843.1 AI-2E family transporter [Wenzhouxiangella sp. 15181]RFP70312.1 AI-2E family transporter [Wenzhouxiangella sp. 15190]
MIARVSDWFQRHFSDPQVVILALFLALGVLAIALFGKMLAPVLASLVLAYLLEGGVQRLERIGVPRLLSVISVFTGFMAALVYLLFGLVPMLTRQIAAIVRDLPSYVALAQDWVAKLPERYPQLVAPAESEAETEAVAGTGSELVADQAERELALISQEQLSRWLDNIGAELVNYGATLVSFSGVMSAVNLLIFLVLMPVLVFFFLKDKHKLVAWAGQYLPRDRDLVTSVWHEVDSQIGNYVRGKVLEILIVWVVTYAVFALFEMPFLMLLSMLVGFSVIIPYIGAAVVTVPVALVALVAFGPGATFWYVLIAYAIIQALDGNLLVPILFSEVVSLHPVAIITAVLIFGGIWGFWGVFFAIPLATLVNAVLRAWPRLPDDDDGKSEQEASADAPV